LIQSPLSNGNKIQFELKGADYNETLIWNSPEDIKVKPFYHSDDISKTFEVNKASEFKICQNIFVFDIEKSIERAIDTLAWSRASGLPLRITT
jgi:methylmalonyl-CoA mutase